MNLHPATARAFWKALTDNAISLIADAHVLLTHESYGRARSMTVLAQEELGKALWLYETFAQSRSTGSENMLEVPRLKTDGRSHAVKYMEAFVFGHDLAAFWGVYDSYDGPLDDSQKDLDKFFAEKQTRAEAAGKLANEDKMSGFYVDLARSGDRVLSPADIAPGTIEEDLQLASRVIEMLLIKDHSRMKLEAVTAYDSTHTQQHKLLPISHPDDWDAASEEFKRGGYWEQKSS